jgi:transposase-like protein
MSDRKSPASMMSQKRFAYVFADAKGLRFRERGFTSKVVSSVRNT